MANGWSSKNVENTVARVVPASQTNLVVSNDFPITAGGATRGFCLKLKVSAVTVAAAITAKLQTAIGDDWVDSKTVTVTADGSFYIKILADNTYMPLLNKGRLVITTGAGDTATIDSVEVLQEL
jgi:hypothetical protein